MLLNQTDVAVDEELEKVIITIYSCTETDIGDNESGYEYITPHFKRRLTKLPTLYREHFRSQPRSPILDSKLFFSNGKRLPLFVTSSELLFAL